MAVLFLVCCVLLWWLIFRSKCLPFYTTKNLDGKSSFWRGLLRTDKMAGLYLYRVSNPISWENPFQEIKMESIIYVAVYCPAYAAAPGSYQFSMLDSTL